MKIKIVYFAYLKPNEWEDIVLEQLNSLKSLDLYNIADKIYISLCCNDNDLKRLKQHLWAKYKKIEIINHYNENQYEFPGIKAIWDLANQDDCLILYFHTKGMTSAEKYPDRHNIRKFLFKNTIENFQEYIDEFKKNDDLDIGCVFPSEFGFSWYNFFWIKSDYIKYNLLEPKISKNRYDWERYIGIENSKNKKNITYSPFLKYNKLGNKLNYTNGEKNYLFNMKHIVITRVNFTDDKKFENYFEVMKKIYIPSINSQSNKNFTLGLSVKSKHYQQIRDLIDEKIEIVTFNDVKQEYKDYVIINDFKIQTRHDCDDYMSSNYIDFIQKTIKDKKNNNKDFVLTFQPTKLDFNTNREYIHERDYSKVCSMFSTLYQYEIKNGIFDVQHDHLKRITPNIFYFKEKYVKLVIHNNNIHSKINQNNIEYK